jgi:hypothetical protein
MPRDYKKMYLEEQTNKLRQELEIEKMKKEIDDLKRINQNRSEIFNPPQQQNPVTPQSPYADPINTSFQNDVRYIVELAQRMSVILKECRLHMLPMELGKKIDGVLREIDRM